MDAQRIDVTPRTQASFAFAAVAGVTLGVLSWWVAQLASGEPVELAQVAVAEEEALVSVDTLTPAPAPLAAAGRPRARPGPAEPFPEAGESDGVVYFRVCKDLSICYLSFSTPPPEVVEGGPPPAPAIVGPFDPVGHARVVHAAGGLGLAGLWSVPIAGGVAVLFLPAAGQDREDEGPEGTGTTQLLRPLSPESPPKPGPVVRHEPVVTPEPASSLLLGTGLALAAALRRRRSRREDQPPPA